jgi:glycosyltransferase involved in cell wall biosynthesis
MNNPTLSIIIPIHNEAVRLPTAMTKLAAAKISMFPDMEVILVENGSTDDSLLWARWFEQTRPWVRVISTKQRGKGLAVRLGMQEARGLYCYMADVDLSTPLKELSRMFDELKNADIVIGSREIDRRMVKASITRRVIGRMFHQVVSGLVPGVQDTQCGFKLFRRSVAQDLFSRMKIDGMAFDVELLYLARMGSYRVKELPVEWVENGDSRVRLGFDSLEMLRDVLSIPTLHADLARSLA